MAKRSGRPSSAQTPAPKSDKIVGSNTNKKGSATNKGASKIKLSDKTISALKTKLEEFKKKYPNKDNVSLSDLKAVYRRGSGAYSGSHRPNVSRAGWSYGRTNKFLEKAAGKKVKAAYVQDDDLLKYEEGGLIAPNGKKSNLTPEQYNLVRTPEFKAWFGDWENEPENASQVVDDNGEPLVVYRGFLKRKNLGNVFRYNIKNFRTAKNRQKNTFAFYFTNEKEVAKEYGENLTESNENYIVQEYFLNIRNLFVAIKEDNEAVKNKKYDKKIDKILAKEDLTFKEIFDLTNPNEKDFNYLKEWGWRWEKKYNFNKQSDSTFTYFVDWDKDDSNQDFWEVYLKRKGYDGLCFYESTHNIELTDKLERKLKFDKLSITYCAFESNQIKLADGTNTTFNSNNLDIRYEEGGKTFNDKELLAKWKRGESIGFTGEAHLKAKALIPRADGEKRKSEKYMEDGGLIEDENGYLKYSIEEDELIIDNIKVYKQRLGTGRKLMNQVKDIARQKKLPISFYAYPQDDTITDDELKEFYESQGFELHPDDSDGRLYKYSNGGKVGEEITCINCGWHWNTNQSKDFDKYVCHKCGYDNAMYYEPKSIGKYEKGNIINKMEKSTKYIKNKKPDYYEKYKGGAYLKKGGQLNPDDKSTKDYYAHKSGNAGGMLVGKRHSEGGIKAVNKSTGQPLEMEGGETVITRDAVSDNTKREFEGEMLTNRQILSKINVSGGGVSFAEGGDVPHKCACSGKKYKYGGDLLPDYHIVDMLGGQHEYFDNLLPSEAFNKMFDFTPKFEEGGTIYEDGGMIRLVSKKVPSLQEYISKNFGISKGLEKKTYKNYLFSTYSIVFDKLPTMVKNGLLMGNQKLVDKYING